MFRVIFSILIFCVVLTVAYLYLTQPSNKNGQLAEIKASATKPVIMIIIDSIMASPLQHTISKGDAPALEFLINNGKYYPKMVSSYPTMSVAIDSTILTGTYPDQHKVPALVWYDVNEERFISYGSASKEIVKLGAKQVFTDSLFHLNRNHLGGNVKTLHEELDGQTASINTLVYRGNQSKQLDVPRILQMMDFLKGNDSVYAPAYFSYGLLSKNNPQNKNTHIWQAFGFNDDFASEELKYLIQQNKLPSFSIVYFSDNDKEVHKRGVEVTKGITEADKKLQEIFNMYGSWEEAIKNHIWIVMGDSGQTYIKKDKEQALIDLRTLLKNYQIHKISKPVQSEDQIVLGLNERMSFIYLLDHEIDQKHVADVLKNDSRFNFIAWKDGEHVNVIAEGKSGLLSFKSGGGLVDQYGQAWMLEGNEEILDLTIKNNQIEYGDYPDGLARLYSSFYSHSGRYLVVDAKPGYEFVGEGSPTHVGGASHGSLHKGDSHFPMIVAGTEEEPKHERAIDLKEWILRVVNKNDKTM